jgi:hypothetical protein
MLSSDFLAEFKRATEGKWHEQPIDPNIYGFQFQQARIGIPGCARTKSQSMRTFLGSGSRMISEPFSGR